MDRAIEGCSLEAKECCMQQKRCMISNVMCNTTLHRGVSFDESESEMLLKS